MQTGNLKTGNSLYTTKLVNNSPIVNMAKFGVRGSTLAYTVEPFSGITAAGSLLWSKEKKVYMDSVYKQTLVAYLGIYKKPSTMTYNQWLKTPLAQTAADRYDKELKGKLEGSGQAGVKGFLNSSSGLAILQGLTSATQIASGQPIMVGGMTVGAGEGNIYGGDAPPLGDTKGKNTMTYVIIGGIAFLLLGVLAIVLISRSKPAAVAAK